MLNFTFCGNAHLISHSSPHRAYPGGVDDSLAVDLLARLCIFDYKPHARRRRDGPAILFGCV